MKKSITILMLVLFAIGMFFTSVQNPRYTSADEKRGEPIVEFVDTGLNYIETLDRIDNPDRGFYQAVSHVLTPTGTSVPSNATVSSFQKYLSGGNAIVHIAFGLEYFSDNAYYAQNSSSKGTSGPITSQALGVISSILTNVRTSGQSCVVRFDYNRGGWLRNSVGNPSGTGEYINAEPNVTTMLQHLTQLEPIFNEFVDVIQVVDTGMVGPWGEMHTTAAARDPDIVNAVINKMLEVVPESRGISVRTPAHYRNWYNAKNGTNYTAATMQEIVIEENSVEGRVGMFNDGLLGNSSDIGTFSTPRTNEINWLKERTKFNFYGGEVTYSGKIDTIGRNGYNDVEYFAYEGFLTHTTYLNSGWNGTVISGWMTVPYDVKPLTNADGQSAKLDIRYKEAQATAYKYISNRLGYRFVIRDLKAHAVAGVGGTASFRGEIENVGFGNTVNEKRTQIIFKNKNTGAIYRQDLDIDTHDWLSSAGNVPLDFDVDLKEAEQNYPTGAYEVYLKINDAAEKAEYRNGALRSIRLANEDIVWNETLGANKIADITITDSLHTVTLMDDDNESVLYEFLYGGPGLNLTPYIVESKMIKGINYNFDRWLGGYTLGMTVSGNLTFTAKFIAEQYPPMQTHTVTLLDDDEETIIETISMLTGDLLDLNYLSVPDKTIEGTRYNFSHWAGGYEDDLIIIRDWTFTAVYTQASTYTVIFNTNGGTLETGTLTQFIEPDGNATPPTLTRSGYVFKGWDSEAYLEVSDDVTINAIWAELFTVTFSLNNGLLYSGELTQTIEKDAAATPPVLIRTGYAFKGWDSEAYLDVKEDITVTAVWVQVFTVTFNTNGGTLSSGNLTQTIEKNTNSTPPILTRDGYTFKGWDTESYLNVTGDVVANAIWEANTSSGCTSSVSTNLLLLPVFAALLLISKRKMRKEA